MNKRILVTLDGSRLAEVILPHAAACARANGYGLTLLHVLLLPGPLNTTAWDTVPATDLSAVLAGWDEEMQRASDYLEGVAMPIRSEGLDVLVDVAQNEAEPASGILSYVEQHPDVCMVAMCTHGRSGLRRWVFGSVAEQVLHDSAVPLLLDRPEPGEALPRDWEIPQYRSLVVPLDGSEFAAQALDVAKTVAAPLHATLTLVSVLPERYSAAGPLATPALPPERVDETVTIASYLQRNRRRLEGEGFAVETRLAYGSPAEAILRVADSSEADLIVMSTHGRSGLSRLWVGSVAMKVVHASTRPVLLVHAKERVKESEPERTAFGVAFSPGM